MSISKQHTRMMYTPAMELAQNIVTNLLPVCQRISIAGSLRRKKVDIGDIEIVCIPKPMEMETLPLFGCQQSETLDSVLNRLVASRGWSVVKDGQWYKQFDIGPLNLDLFITTPEKWGVVYVIRTGPSEFSHRLVTKQRYGGLCPSWASFKDGRIWANGHALETPEEKDVFAVLGLDYIEPEDRT